MKNNIKLEDGQELFVGIDLHNKNWHITIRTKDFIIMSANIPPQWMELKKQLDKYPDQKINTVYEAGYFDFWLHDALTEYGVNSIVTPPSLIPTDYGNKVKTDKKDSQKMAQFLSKGILRAVYTPTKEELYLRQVSRRRRQFVRDRTRIQCRIKGELKFFGIDVPPAPSGKWTKDYLKRLKEIKLEDSFAQKSFQYMLKQYEFLNDMVKKQLKLLKILSQKINTENVLKLS
ncbi:MAG: transposase [Spirochaetota bacterium]|nr:transposase [Spirochaetota bacterium]